MEEVRTREEMYDLVWSVPMRTLAKRFNISDVALRKRCLKAAVPTPPAGYWTKVRAGREAVRTPLPTRPAGMSCLVGPAAQRHHAAMSLDHDVDRHMAPDPNWSMTRAREVLSSRFATLLQVARGRRHPLIRSRLERDRELRAKAVPGQPLLPFEKPIFGSKFDKRRLSFLNKLILICEAEGAKFGLSGPRGDPITVTINDVVLAVALEDRDAIQRRFNSARRSRGGEQELAFAVLKRPGSVGRIWRDLKDGRLEQQLPMIAAELFIVAEQRYRERLQAEQAYRVATRSAELRAAEARAEERAREQRALEEAAEKMRIQRLLAEARAFHDAHLVRQYVDHLRAASPEEKGPAFEQWARWALSVATGEIEV